MTTQTINPTLPAPLKATIYATADGLRRLNIVSDYTPGALWTTIEVSTCRNPQGHGVHRRRHHRIDTLQSILAWIAKHNAAPKV